MSLINVNNSSSVYGVVRSIQLHSPSHGGRYLDTNSTETDVMHAVMALAHGQSKVSAARYLAGLIDAWLNNPSDRMLYNLMSALNAHEWRECAIDCQVEYGIEATGHGDVPIEAIQHVILLVKTTWQDAN